MLTVAEQLENFSSLGQITVPDLWQQQAVSALRNGNDVVVQAPTGAGKTLIFELWSKQGRNSGQAIYTVPTRALANDKLAEWRGRGWDVGIATGDLSENLGAPILVATLETQKNRLIRGDGPVLLVVDEYQMLGDRERGLNYELAIAMAPPRTQLLLMSGSVENPRDIVKWLTRLGRKAVLIHHLLRPVPQEEVFVPNLSYRLPPVPQEEVFVPNLSYRLPEEVRSYWARFCAKVLAEGLGPILIFAPRRANAEAIAVELMRQLPCPHPLSLTQTQKVLVGDSLARMLRTRVSYHHSGLSYAARAGVIEPLAKSGALRVVVATMGLAAGINFSLRSVALAGDSYRRDQVEQPLRPDEILQMFGRAGRRGIDETGFILVGANELRMRDGYATHLSRSGMVDWNALLSLMSVAAEVGHDPFQEAVRVQQRLFSTKPVVLGVEESLKHPNTPCGLKTDPERARHVRKRIPQMLNSRGRWERMPPFCERPLRDVFVMETPPEAVLNLLKLQADCPPHADVSSDPAILSAIKLVPALSHSPALEKVGHGTLAVISENEVGQKLFGRAITVAEVVDGDRLCLMKWIRRLINWNGRVAPMSLWEPKIVPLIRQRLQEQKLQVEKIERQDSKLIAISGLGEVAVRVPVDAHGIALWHPVQREVISKDCASCHLRDTCLQMPTATSTAMLWRRLGLVDSQGVPTRRGKVAGFFQKGDGLAIAAGLEDESYPLEEMVYDIANLDAGFRFSGDEGRWGGGLAIACQKLFGLQNVPGYLDCGLPLHYGDGAERIVAAAHKNTLNKAQFISEFLGSGDIDRAIIEWRSLLRQIAHAPFLAWPRWQSFQAMAKAILQETESPTITDFPPLEFHQSKRLDHRLAFRRH